MGILEMVTLIVAAAVASGTPILLAALGELVAERGGILNLGIEGMMLVGAFSGFFVAHATGSAALGALAAVLLTGAFSLLHAFTSVVLNADQVVSGLALWILGAGLASFFGMPLVGEVAASFPRLTIPGLSSIPFLGPVLFDHNGLVYLTFLLLPVTAFVLNRTRVGLNLQVCGENPRCADTAGLNVRAYRIVATGVGGMLSGLAGAYLSLADTPSWVDGMSGGRGWIALAMVIFSGWSVSRLAVGAYLFGGMVAIQFRIQAFGLEAPTYLLKMLPYLATLGVLVLANHSRFRRSFGAPAALGLPYAREER